MAYKEIWKQIRNKERHNEFSRGNSLRIIL